MKMMKYFAAIGALLFMSGCDVDTNELSKYYKDDVISEVVEVAKAVTPLLIEETPIEIKDSELAESFTPAKVVNVVDGDTIDIIRLNESGEPLSTEKERIRFLLINSPESKGQYAKNPQPYGLEASDFTEMLLMNQLVFLEFDKEETDRYGRTLAYIWLDSVTYQYDGEQYTAANVTINELLLKHGLAHVAVYQPNVKYKEHFYSVEDEAKANRVGIWK